MNERGMRKVGPAVSCLSGASATRHIHWNVLIGNFASVSQSSQCRKSVDGIN